MPDHGAEETSGRPERGSTAAMDARLRMPGRDPAGHKGTFGTVLVVGGCAGGPRPMLGAPAFAALGAVRAGAGLVQIAAPAPLIPAILTCVPFATAIALPVDHHDVLDASACAAVLDDALPPVDAVVLGPGLGAGRRHAHALAQIILRLVAQEDRTIVVDADAITILAAQRDFARDLRARLILTPHPGEFRRLAEALSLHLTDPVTAEDRADAAGLLARRLGCVAVLKGPDTIVTDGHETFLTPTGGPALATGGTGDVLAGVIGGLVAQFAGQAQTGRTAGPSLPLLHCAAIGAHVHGLAADRWSAAGAHGRRDAGMLPDELAAHIPDAIATVRRRADA